MRPIVYEITWLNMRPPEGGRHISVTEKWRFLVSPLRRLNFKSTNAHSAIAAAIFVCLAGAPAARAQAPADSARNSYPNPYRTIENWAKLPEGRTWGAAAGVDVDRHGNIWVANAAAPTPARVPISRPSSNLILRANC